MWKLLIVLLFACVAEACPLGKGEEQLTVQRVMRNLGRFTVKADMYALKGTQPHEKVSSAELKTTISDLELAISCARVASDSPTGFLLPTCTQALSGKEFDDYVALYVKLMKDFEAELVVYQKIFKDILEQKDNFGSAYLQSQKIEKIVEDAHKKLFGN